MNYRHAEVLAEQDLGESGTKIIDIDVKDPISRLTLIHRPVGGSNTPIAHPVKNIVKIELVDGSEVLYSLNGYQGQALNCFDSKQPIIQEVDGRTGGVPMCYVHLDFGRWMWDEELAFDPKRFKNPQLKLTWNEANYDASCTSHGFMIYASVFDEKIISPLGFLMSKLIKSFAPTSGAYEYTDLPTDYPMRKLFVQGLKYGAGVRGLIEQIRLSEDNDKRIPIDGDVDHLRSFLDEMGGDCIDVIRGNCAFAASQYYYCTPSNVFTLTAVGDVAARVIAAGAPSGGRFWAQAETGVTGIVVVARGKNPHGCIGIPFGNQDNLNDWYDVTKLGSLRLRLKGGTSSVAGDEVNICTQQLKRY